MRVIANLGRLDKITPSTLDPLITASIAPWVGLRTPRREDIQEPSRSYGGVFALLHELGIDKALQRVLRSLRRGFDVEALIRAVVSPSALRPGVKARSDEMETKRRV